MSEAFRARVRQAIADAKLQTALDRNAERRMSAWEKTFASLPEAHRLRQQARQVRQGVVQDLDRTLSQFSQQAERNGFRVHHAASAEDACQTVLSIARRHNTDLIAKSKSMVSEEIGLNKALTQAGIRVVETDLGEFIVQLRNEPPAHIITPAVHLLREDVATTFSQELGMPYSEDVEAMNAAARSVLRDIFLEAQIGISGVNFGVAENGVLCLVTNEGNGRMVTTVPAVHIALMGVERIVPTLDDLDVMLRLLPRSATGQKLTSYVTLIRGPRHESDPDGPEERHLILVDNGRSALATTGLSEALLCIRCGACLNICPVYREIGGHAYHSVYPGPIGSVISPGLFGIEAYGHLATASTLCGACQEVCPVQIDLPKLLLRTRQAYRQASPLPRMMRRMLAFYTWVMNSPGRYRIVRRLAAIATRLLPRKKGWVNYLPPPFNAWTAGRHQGPF
jgi:L-lactate dehydrogenase complex protein LldF